MRFSRSKFYHRRAGLPRLDLLQSGCETQFIARKPKKEKDLTQRTQIFQP